MTVNTRRIGVVMDPIASIKPLKDSTLAMLLEASRRGAEIHYMLQADLKLVAGEAFARSRILTVRDSEDDWYEFGEESEWWGAQAKRIEERTRRPLRRIRIPREAECVGRDEELARLRARAEFRKI